MPRSSIHRLRVGQGPSVLTVGVGVGLFEQFYSFCSLHLSPGDGSIEIEMLPQRTGKPKTKSTLHCRRQRPLGCTHMHFLFNHFYVMGKGEFR